MEYIYLLKNKTTGRIYVGKTHDVQWRFKQHMSALSGHRHANELMQKDFDLYGKESFCVGSVEESENFTRSGIEMWWMKRLKTYDKRFGYNYKDPYFKHRSGKFTKNNPLRKDKSDKKELQEV